MSRYSWIKQIDFQKFAMPFVIKSDSEYFPAVSHVLLKFVSELEHCKASDKIINEIKEYREKVISSINLYYQGNLVDAQIIINEMLDEFDNAAPAITDINSSFAFPGGGPEHSEVQFFRARLSDSVVEFSAEEMLHIPFNKRHIVKSERFSIPGLPCLYLGNSSYACWVEMGCPADHQFNVSPLVLDNTIPTPYLLKPIEWGCDIVIHSATKYLGGHGNSIAGIIIDSGNFDWEASGKFPGLTTPDESYHGITYAEKFGKGAYITKATAQLMRDLGSIQSPQNAFYVNLGLETLHLRMERHSKNALEIRAFLRRLLNI